jgi:NAD(P)-dependent dehydrogenase (short-subunit alcohol dehydrogenase family)
LQINGAFASALEGLTRGLALDLGKMDDLRIRVNCVMPGPVKTPLWDGVPKDAVDSMMEQFAQQALTKSVPGPEIVAQAYRE